MMKNSAFYKTEGNILYPDGSMLTWGPFYYESEERAKERIEPVLQDIVDWCNSKDSSLNVSPENLIRTVDDKQVIFDIRAWKDDNTLQECGGIITVESCFFVED